ncbi:MAG TPA: hypothetical protein G4O18_10550 [Dehalococcoidia bacterium]|nr:hypothetical protein [Dehalococcoidia bacterium]
MKRQVTSSSVVEVDFGVVTEVPQEKTVVEEQTELSPAPEHSTVPEKRKLKPLTLVLTILALALMILIPSLLLMQRLQP